MCGSFRPFEMDHSHVVGQNHKLNVFLMVAMNLNLFDASLLMGSQKKATNFNRQEAAVSLHPTIICILRWNGKLVHRCHVEKEPESKGISGLSQKSSKSGKDGEFQINEHIMVWIPSYWDVHKCSLEVEIFANVPGKPLENGQFLGCVCLQEDALFELVFPAKAKDESQQGKVFKLDSRLQMMQSQVSMKNLDDLKYKPVAQRGTWFNLQLSEHMDQNDQESVGGRLLIRGSLTMYKEPPNIVLLSTVEENHIKKEKVRLYDLIQSISVKAREHVPPFIYNRTVDPKLKYEFPEDLDHLPVGGGRLSVFIIEACELKKVAHAFAEVWVNGREIGRTGIVTGMNPMWEDDPFEVNLPYFMDVCDCQLEIRIYDKSRMGTLTFLGCLKQKGKELEVFLKNQLPCYFLFIYCCVNSLPWTTLLKCGGKY